ncbi:MAG TPA: sensor domain-containing diguanylate cyclase [Thermomicrobiales bacterium]|nr:sensor domain-containing diguanylate cyclase [Thermomicrobiales bacterium]
MKRTMPFAGERAFMSERDIGQRPEILAQARGWYTIRREEMSDELLASLWPTYTGGLSLAQFRIHLQEVAQGLIDNAVAPELMETELQHVGARVSDLCNFTLEGLEELRQVVPMILTRDLPDHLSPFVESRIERILTNVIWGYCSRVSERGMFPAMESVFADGQDSGSNILDTYFTDHPLALGVQSIATEQVVAINQKFEDFFGYTLESFPAPDYGAILAPESANDLTAVIEDLRVGRIESFYRHGALRHRLGHTVWYELHAFRMYDRQRVARWIGYMFKPARSRAAVAGSDEFENARIRVLSELSLDPALIVASTRAIKYASAATERVLGFEPADVLDQPISMLVIENDHVLLEGLLTSLSKRPRATDRIELRLRRKDGGWRWFEIAGANLLDVQEIAGYSLQARDITERKRLEQLLTMQAHLDPLTSLLNRRGMMERVDAALLARERVAVLFIDLDYFKAINDRFGHIVGDIVLRTIAERLDSQLATLGIVGRLGGDEFLVLANSADRFHLQRIREEVVALLEEPIAIDGEVHLVGGSIGVAWSDPSVTTSTELLRKADVEMYRAKSRR